MKRKGDVVVSLNPKYGLEIERILELANHVRDTNPALYTILTAVASSILAKDEKHLSDYCRAYLFDAMYNKSFKSELEDIFGNYLDGKSTKNPKSLETDDDEL
tara:strand:+ start:73592 stop:73900 length:309 start_codon:yes stop_codon:yes gene_type:complete